MDFMVVEVPRKKNKKRKVDYMLREIKENVMKTTRKIMLWIKNKKIVFVNGVVTLGLIIGNTICVHASGSSSKLKSASNSAQQEMLGWAEALGILGIVAGALLWMSGNTQKAKQVILGVGVGYVLVKFAPDLWAWFISIF